MDFDRSKLVAESYTKVLEYKDSVKIKAEELVLKGFPKKIVELNKLLDTPQFGRRDLSEVHQSLNIPVPEPIALNNWDGRLRRSNSQEPITKSGLGSIPSHAGGGEHQPPAKRKKLVDQDANSDHEHVSGTRVMALCNGIVPCNKYLVDLIKIVKPHIRVLVEDANLLKMWVSYMIPKIEDGNNFGVSIQEDTLAEIQSVESEAAAFFDQMSRYFVTRGKIISKVAKYPHVEDYRIAVEELDEKEYLSLWLVMCEVRNRYCTLHDIVIKNLEKIKKPRTSNAESLY